MLLPWEYGVRNLSRRPLRTALTMMALAIVILLVFVVVGFIRGLEKSLRVSGDSKVVLVYSVNAEANIENSAIASRAAPLLSASVQGIAQSYQTPCVSPELYLGTRIETGSGRRGLGLVRGVTSTVPLVRPKVLLDQGRWPTTNEVMIGRLAAAKLGVDPADLAIGKTICMEGEIWKIVGQFSAAGSSLESEIWCELPKLQTATKRQDISLVAIAMKSENGVAGVSLFCQQRLDLELKAVRETEYYASLQQHYKPVRFLGWTVVLLVSAAGVFAGLNMMYGAVAGRTREIATLQAMGYRRRAILVSLLQEGVLLSAAASLLAGLLAAIFVDGRAIRFTMGAFTLQMDSVAVLIGCCTGLAIGALGAMPPALKVLRQSVAQNLKSS